MLSEKAPWRCAKVCKQILEKHCKEPENDNAMS